MSFQVDINTPEIFKAEVLETPGTLQVVELYQSWCGPCKAIVSTFKRLYFDNGDRALKFYTLNVDKVNDFKTYSGNCVPVFQFYTNGKKIDEIVGVKAPELTKAVLSLSEPARLAAA